MTGPVHDAARTGFEREASAYARGRPDYPEALGGWLQGTLGLRAGTVVADVGAGTGKFSRLLMKTGAEVIAVEPVEAMRAQAAQVEGLRVVEGSAQDMPLGDASIDAIVCAQAFHWFASTESLDEFARVLEAGGRLGLIWNVRDESVDWVHRITELITPYEGDAPRFYKGDWRKPFPHAAFTPMEEAAFEHVHEGPPEMVIIDRFMSVSFIAAQDAPTREHIRGALQDLIAQHPDLRGREVVRFPYRTLAYHCMRR